MGAEEAPTTTARRTEWAGAADESRRVRSHGRRRVDAFAALVIVVATVVVLGAVGVQANKQGYRPVKEKLLDDVRDKAHDAYAKDYDIHDVDGHVAGAQFACGMCLTMANNTETMIKQRCSEEGMMDLFRATCLKMEPTSQGVNNKALCLRVVDDLGEDVIAGMTTGESVKEVCQDACNIPKKEDLLRQARAMEQTRKDNDRHRQLLKEHEQAATGDGAGTKKPKKKKPKKKGAPRSEL